MRSGRAGAWRGYRTARVAVAPAGVLFVIIALIAACPVAASEVDKGRQLAQALCASCHMGEHQGEKQGPMGIPSFRAVANRRGQTEQAVVDWLKSIPPMMPNHHLTQDESYALAAYIMTLRTGR